MIPHFVVHHQECETCEAEILIGYEAILHEDGYFCIDLPYDFMTKEEREKLNGEVITYFIEKDGEK